MVAPPPPLTTTFWSSFWKNQIPHNARNVWWRLLINKLPSGLHLHSIIPDMVEPLCRVCGTSLETSQHLLFSCPKKLEVWQGALSKYVEERAWTADFICSLFFPDPDPDQAFEPRMVLAAVDLAITQIRAQLAEKKRQNEEREPPPPVDHPPVNNNFPT
ncbi:hypothetical protein BGZ90_006406 [Linnemannia elongata]|nr:hypothetical protein BGZ90_006406 [Linnemannia elongata]